MKRISIFSILSTAWLLLSAANSLALEKSLHVIGEGFAFYKFDRRVITESDANLVVHIVEIKRDDNFRFQPVSLLGEYHLRGPLSLMDFYKIVQSHDSAFESNFGIFMLTIARKAGEDWDMHSNHFRVWRQMEEEFMLQDGDILFLQRHSSW